MASDPTGDETLIFVAIESFACMRNGAPYSVQRGDRMRGGKGSVPAQFPQWFLPDGALADEIAEARERAGLVYG